MTINLIDLKERIAISQEYTPEERDLILAALNIGGDYCDQHVHVYPSKYPRKSDSFWLNETWDIMDKLPPDAMPTNYRFLLAGIIYARLRMAYDLGTGKLAGKKV